MAKVLLDSDVIIEWLRGHQPFVEQVPKLIEEHSELFWCPVSVAEIFAGVRKGEEDAVANLFLLLEPATHSPAYSAGRPRRLEIVPSSEQFGDEFGDVDRILYFQAIRSTSPNCSMP